MVMKRKFLKVFGTCLVILSVLLSGCSGTNSESLTEYRDSMNGFFDRIANLDSDINSFDTGSTDYSSLLSKLDALNREFKSMSELEVPEEFIGVKELSVDAFSHMSKSISLYHDFFENSDYDQSIADEASQHYLLANKELKYIIEILHGRSYEEVVKSDP